MPYTGSEDASERVPVTRLLSRRVWGKISSEQITSVNVVSQCASCDRYHRKDIASFQKFDLSEQLLIPFECPCGETWKTALALKLTAELVHPK